MDKAESSQLNQYASCTVVVAFQFASYFVDLEPLPVVLTKATKKQPSAATLPHRVFVFPLCPGSGIIGQNRWSLSRLRPYTSITIIVESLCTFCCSPAVGFRTPGEYSVTCLPLNAP